MDESHYEFSELKLVFLGNGGAGKTSILQRYISDSFSVNMHETSGAMFFAKDLHHQGHSYKLQIWDTAGQERFRAITPLYFKDAHGIILVCDISNPETVINSLNDWYNDVKEKRPSDQHVICVCGNKSDLVSEEERQEMENVIQQWTNQKKCPYVITSAKEG